MRILKESLKLAYVETVTTVGSHPTGWNLIVAWSLVTGCVSNRSSPTVALCLWRGWPSAARSGQSTCPNMLAEVWRVPGEVLVPGQQWKAANADYNNHRRRNQHHPSLVTGAGVGGRKSTQQGRKMLTRPFNLGCFQKVQSTIRVFPQLLRQLGQPFSCDFLFRWL